MIIVEHAFVAGIKIIRQINATSKKPSVLNVRRLATLQKNVQQILQYNTHSLKAGEGVQGNDVDNGDNDSEIYTIYKCNKVKSEAIIIHPKVNGISTPMEVDTGGSLSVIKTFLIN